LAISFRLTLDLEAFLLEGADFGCPELGFDGLGSRCLLPFGGLLRGFGGPVGRVGFSLGFSLRPDGLFTLGLLLGLLRCSRLSLR